MKRLVFVFLVFCFCHPVLFAQTVATNEEYAVFASILRKINRENLKRFKTENSFVILNETLKTVNIERYEAPKMKGLIKNFKLKNKKSSILKPLIPVSYQYKIISSPQLNRLLTKDTGEIPWKGFYEKFPKANGYYLLSRVGFSLNKEFALVYVERANYYNGDSMKYILRKVKGKWKIYSQSGVGWDD